MCTDRCRRPGDEDGVALIAVLLAVIVLFGLAVVFVATSTFESRSTAGSRDFEAVLHVAEAAIDDVIPSINTDGTYVSTNASGDTYTRPSGRQEMIDLGLAVESDELVRMAEGDSFAIRPADDDGPLDEIWAVGWVPNRENASRTRVLRIEFDKLRFSPDVGFLSGGGLAFGGNASVTGDFGNVHLNGDASETGGKAIGNFSIEGDLTAAGSIPPSVCQKLYADISGDERALRCRAGAAPRPIPEVDTRSIYDVRHAASGQEWFDLCPPTLTGPATIRRWSSAGPCQATGDDIVWRDASGFPSSYRGWRYERPTGGRPYHRWRGQDVQEGIYYVHHGNAFLQTTSGGSPRGVTIIASERTSSWETGLNVGNQGAASGHIRLGGNANITSVLAGLALVADRDIVLAGGAEITGLVAMNEQIEVEGTVTITGAVLVEDAKDTPGSWVERPSKLYGNMNIHYDGGLDVPLAGVIRITSWDEP